MGFDRDFHNYKYWIQNRAEEIALEDYDSEFYGLPTDKQREVYHKATEAYNEAYADSIDATYEAIRELNLRGRQYS